MKIAIDIDGVLLDLMVNFCEIYNVKYNSNYNKEDVTHWEFFKDWGITEKECYDIFYYIYENTMQVPLIDMNSSEIMKKLYQKHHVDILSARKPIFKTQLIKKLNFHNIKDGIQYKELFLVNNKPYDKKLDYNYKIYIDDNPNLVESIKNYETRYLLLYDQPWNRQSICEQNVIRVKSWIEIYEIIKSI